MNLKEKMILKIAIDRKKGLYSPADMINGIAGHDRALIENLVTKKYLEEVSTEIPTGATYNFYRVSHKGLMFFSPWYEKLWFNFKNDLRTITVSIITTIITTIATIIIGNLLK